MTLTITSYHGGEHWFQCFRDSGSSMDMNVDGSTTPVSFRVTAPAGKSVHLERVLFMIEDGAIRLNRFGGTAVLSNGLTIKLFDENDNELIDFLDGATIKRLGDFTLIAGTDNVAAAASGDDTWTCRWTISKAGSPLFMQAGHYLEVLVQDNLSSVSIFRAEAQGMMK